MVFFIIFQLCCSEKWKNLRTIINDGFFQFYSLCWLSVTTSCQIFTGFCWFRTSGLVRKRNNLQYDNILQILISVSFLLNMLLFLNLRNSLVVSNHQWALHLLLTMVILPKQTNILVASKSVRQGGHCVGGNIKESTYRYIDIYVQMQMTNGHIQYLTCLVLFFCSSMSHERAGQLVDKFNNQHSLWQTVRHSRRGSLCIKPLFMQIIL